MNNPDIHDGLDTACRTDLFAAAAAYTVSAVYLIGHIDHSLPVYCIYTRKDGVSIDSISMRKYTRRILFQSAFQLEKQNPSAGEKKYEKIILLRMIL